MLAFIFDPFILGIDYYDFYKEQIYSCCLYLLYFRDLIIMIVVSLRAYCKDLF